MKNVILFEMVKGVFCLVSKVKVYMLSSTEVRERLSNPATGSRGLIELYSLNKT
jgi:hypothetical protein